MHKDELAKHLARIDRALAGHVARPPLIGAKPGLIVVSSMALGAVAFAACLAVLKGLL
jgi:hypothetical protein